VRVHLQEGTDELEKEFVLRPDSVLEGCLLGNQDMVEVILHVENEILFAEVFRNFGTRFNHPLRPRTQYTLHASKHPRKADVVEQNVLGPQLSHYTAHTPDINLAVIRGAQDDLRRSVAARLDVECQMVMNEAGIAQVHHFDNWRRVGLYQDVLRFEVGVHYVQRVEGCQGCQDLCCDCFYCWDAEIGGVFAVGHEEVIA